MASPDPRQTRSDDTETTRILDRGRKAYARRAWADAHGYFRHAVEHAPLDAEDLERLAASAYLIGRDDEYLGALNRAHKAHAEAGDAARAIRCAFWLGLELAFRGEMGPAGGWFGRAQRLLKHQKSACVEEGYLLLPLVEQHLHAGDAEKALATAAHAVEIGERFGDADLGACARHLQGKALIRQQRIEEGLALLDEAMAAVTTGELSPIMTGLVYCSVIEACRQVYALDRAGAWTSALTSWCAEQPQLVAFTRACLVHRAQIMRHGGAWDDAIAETGRVCMTICEGTELQPPGEAFYERAEIHRLRGEFPAAEEDYREANRHGFEPQPGLSLLRLVQGRTADAVAAMRRVLDAVGEPLRRSRLLPAWVEIALEAGEMAEAHRAADELQEFANTIDAPVLKAIAAQAGAAVALADGDARSALGFARRALAVWLQVEEPYEAARARVLMGLACRSLDDNDGAFMELDTACSTFHRLGAAPDLARVEALLSKPAKAPAHGLSPRELQVVRLVAEGKTNKAIAEELRVSVRTVDRHLENVFTKLDLPSRAAATAYAYRHNLM
ncbi:LuxR family transcriptional regulator [Chelativorans salis]|uniref:LuxR C-terminal-related transcriptional regulator n=1 Tax=Chelativorans salis TaxID=2978478 RepID=A0ABT2LHW5_9HYPH|nr:LuxR family transcriptional regulator [Chelativorans sp. EGI FJ00035]MCT7374165.1 LuxR C-terminal-related transcriptional regulator [Chelativorans sp. EGI FJ00035]